MSRNSRVRCSRRSTSTRSSCRTMSRQGSSAPTTPLRVSRISNSHSHTSPSKPLQGHFNHGVWHCNCRPRLPAEHFEVKKEGPNRGRWFYVCQKAQSQRCDFFLWDTDAKPREEAAVLSNSRTEPRRPPQPPDRAGSTSESPSTTRTGSSIPTTRRIDVDSLRLSDSSARPQPSSPDWPSSASDDDAAPPSPSPVTRVRVEPSTPRKAARTTITITSPSKRRRASSPAASPRTPHRDTGHNPAPDPFSTPQPPMTYPTPLTTPTPSRALDPSITPSSATTAPLSQQILALLTAHAVTLPPAARSALAELTQTHELRMRGVVRGRDIARVAVRKREEVIAGLKARVGGLEVEREGLVRLSKGARGNERVPGHSFLS